MIWNNVGQYMSLKNQLYEMEESPMVKSDRASNTESISMAWRLHAVVSSGRCVKSVHVKLQQNNTKHEPCAYLYFLECIIIANAAPYYDCWCSGALFTNMV